jgi:hypothetical protein
MAADAILIELGVVDNSRRKRAKLCNLAILMHAKYSAARRYEITLTRIQICRCELRICENQVNRFLQRAQCNLNNTMGDFKNVKSVEGL